MHGERREIPTRETLMVTMTTTIPQEIKRALDTGTQIEPFTVRMPQLSLADAYDAAQLVREMRTREGARVVDDARFLPASPAVGGSRE